MRNICGRHRSPSGIQEEKMDSELGLGKAVNHGEGSECEFTLPAATPYLFGFEGENPGAP